LCGFFIIKEIVKACSDFTKIIVTKEGHTKIITRTIYSSEDRVVSEPVEEKPEEEPPYDPDTDLTVIDDGEE